MTSTLSATSRKWSQTRTNSTISAHHPHYALPSRPSVFGRRGTARALTLRMTRCGPESAYSNCCGKARVVRVRRCSDFCSTVPGFELVSLVAATLYDRPVVRLRRLGPVQFYSRGLAITIRKDPPAAWPGTSWQQRAGYFARLWSMSCTHRRRHSTTASASVNRSSVRRHRHHHTPRRARA
jgi:hypothetical protein